MRYSITCIPTCFLTLAASIKASPKPAEQRNLIPVGERSAVQRALRFSRRFDLFLTEVDRTFAQDPARIHKERAGVYKARKQHPEEVHEIDQELRIEGCVSLRRSLGDGICGTGVHRLAPGEAKRVKRNFRKTEMPDRLNMPNYMQPWETPIWQCSYLIRVTETHHRVGQAAGESRLRRYADRSPIQGVGSSYRVAGELVAFIGLLRAGLQR